MMTQNCSGHRRDLLTAALTSEGLQSKTNTLRRTNMYVTYNGIYYSRSTIVIYDKNREESIYITYVTS